MTSDRHHHDKLHHFIATLDATPDAVLFHYVRAVVDEEGGNVSAAARRIGVHRRSLQRMLEKPRPKGRVTE